MSMKTRELQGAVMAQLVEAIGKGVVPWRQSWLSDMPRNPITKRNYHGMNVLTLWITQMKHHYGDQLWASFRQWGGAGGRVKKGEKGTPIVFFKRTQKIDKETGDPIRFGVYRLSYIFNIAQVEDVPQHLQPKPRLFVPLGVRHAEAQAVIDRHRPTVVAGEPKYVIQADTIGMPAIENFNRPDDYFRTFFHELGHWTGAKHRLDRDSLLRRHSHVDKAQEELTAELTSAFLTARLGLEQDPHDNSATYIAGWLRAIQDHQAALFSAAAAASRAMAFLMPDELVEESELQEAA